MNQRSLRILFALAASAGVASIARAQSTRPAASGSSSSSSATQPENRAAYIRENYTKYEYKIPMRDGVHLFTAVYIPKDDTTTYPIILNRTPYSVKPYGEDLAGGGGPMSAYAQDKFIFAFQDVRGKNASEGTFVHMRPQIDQKTPGQIDESSDAYDTIDWLVHHVPLNNGNVGMMGISYPGFYSAAGMIDSHPALKCVSPQAPISDWFIGDDFHHNGVFYLPHAFNFLAGFGRTYEDPLREPWKRFDFKTPNGYDFYLRMGPVANADKLYFKGQVDFWGDLMAHPDYDAYWQSRNLRPHLHNVHAAVMTVGGWYDAEDLFGALEVFKNTDRLNPTGDVHMVMGPWYHGEWSSPDGDHLGLVDFRSKTSQYYREHLELPFLNHYLKPEKAKDDHFKLAKATVFETGTNQWRHYDAWPPKTAAAKPLYLHAGGKLSFDPPAANEGPEFDEYVSDPAKPVPFVPYISLGMTREHMVDDQRFAAMRPDVLAYETDTLDEDVTLAGPITARMQVSTSGTDSDFVVKVIDVYSNDFPNPDAGTGGGGGGGGNQAGSAPPYPAESAHFPPIEMGGYEQLVRGEIMRGKFRNSYEKPEPFTPGAVADVHWTMPDIYHTFRRGHRIMIQVQSSWFPLADRNPQKFCNINTATADDFQKATERVYHSTKAASQIMVMVLPQPVPTTAPATEPAH